MDLISMERSLVQQKIVLRGRREQASGAKAGAMAATAMDQFYTTMAIFQQFGSSEMKEMIERVREY